METWKLYTVHTTRKSAQDTVRMLKNETTKHITKYRIEYDEDQGWCLWLRET